MVKKSSIKMKCLILIFFIPIFAFTQHSSYYEDSLKLVSSAFKTLQSQMNSNDFKKLNWTEAKVDTLPKAFLKHPKISNLNIEPILKLSSIEDTNRIFLYTEQKGIKYFNWVYLNLVNDSGFYSGNIQTFSVKNNLLKTWQIRKDETLPQQKMDSIAFGNIKIPAPSPQIINRGYSTVSGNKSSIVFFSAYYLLFDENLADKNPLSNTYFLLNDNALLYFPFGHMSNSKISEGLEVHKETTDEKE